MDIGAAVQGLGRAVELQYRSTLSMTAASGALRGLQFQSLADRLWMFARAELVDSRRLIEKLVALGGSPPATRVELTWEVDHERFVVKLIEHEREAVNALGEIMPATGTQAHSEALEHLLEHVIMRKQEQIDYLVRATADTSPPHASAGPELVELRSN